MRIKTLRNIFKNYNIIVKLNYHGKSIILKTNIDTITYFCLILILFTNAVLLSDFISVYNIHYFRENFLYLITRTLLLLIFFSIIGYSLFKILGIKLQTFTIIYAGLGISLSVLFGFIIIIFTSLNFLIVILFFAAVTAIPYLIERKDIRKIKRKYLNYLRGNISIFALLCYLLFHFARILIKMPLSAPADSYVYGYLALATTKENLLRNEFVSFLSYFRLPLFYVIGGFASALLQDPPLLTLPILGALGSILIACSAFEAGRHLTGSKTMGLLLSLLFTAVPFATLKFPLPVNDLTVSNIANGTYQQHLAFTIFIAAILAHIILDIQNEKKVILIALMSAVAVLLNYRFTVFSYTFFIVTLLNYFFSRKPITRIFILSTALLMFFLALSPATNPLISNLLYFTRMIPGTVFTERESLKILFERINYNVVCYLVISCLTFLLIFFVKSNKDDALVLCFVCYVVFMFLSLNDKLYNLFFFYLSPLRTVYILYPLSLFVILKIFSNKPNMQFLIILTLTCLFIMSGGIQFSLKYYLPENQSISSIRQLSRFLANKQNDVLILNEPSWKGMQLALVNDLQLSFNYYIWKRSYENNIYGPANDRDIHIFSRNQEFLNIFIQPTNYSMVNSILKKYNVKYLIITDSWRIVVPGLREISPSLSIYSFIGICKPLGPTRYIDAFNANPQLRLVANINDEYYIYEVCFDV